MTYKSSVTVERSVARTIIVTFDPPIPITVTRASNWRAEARPSTTGLVTGFRYFDTGEADTKPQLIDFRLTPLGVEHRKDGQARERTTYEWSRTAKEVCAKWIIENPDWWRA